MSSNISFELSDLRYWFRGAAYKYLFATLLTLLTSLIIYLSHSSDDTLTLSLQLLMISTVVPFFSFFIMSSSVSRGYFTRDNIGTLAVIRAFDLSLVYPILLMVYVNFLNIESGWWYIIYYLGFVSMYLSGYPIELFRNLGKMILMKISVVFSLVCATTMVGLVLWRLFQLPYLDNQLLYWWIIIFIILHYRWYITPLTYQPGTIRHFCMEPSMITIDLQDRFYTIGGLFIYSLFL